MYRKQLLEEELQRREAELEAEAPTMPTTTTT
jgi:hypothetical protein